MENTLGTKVRDIIINTLHVDESEVTPQANLRGDLGCDSLDAVEIIMNVEKEFGISISDDDADKLNTVEDIVKYLESKNVKV